MHKAIELVIKSLRTAERRSNKYNTKDMCCNITSF